MNYLCEICDAEAELIIPLPLDDKFEMKPYLSQWQCTNGHPINSEKLIMKAKNNEQ